MAQELEYGDRECEVEDGLEEDLKDYLERIGSNNTSPDQFCEEKDDSESLDNGTAYCYWFYNGQGVEYQLLAGPIYIVMFACSGILLGEPEHHHVFVCALTARLWCRRYDAGDRSDQQGACAQFLHHHVERHDGAGRLRERVLAHRSGETSARSVVSLQ